MGARELCLYIIGGLGLLALLFLLVFSKPGSFGSPPLVGVILWDKELHSFVENLQGVVEGLREEGYQDGLNLKLQVVNAAAERARAASAAQNLDEAGAQLLITLGTVPTLAALEVTRQSRTPILYSHVGDPESTGLAWPEEPGERRFTGTSSGVEAEEQLRFLLLAMPGLRRLGILHCTATPVAEATAAALEAAVRARGLEVIRAVIPDDRPELLQKAMRRLVTENVEVLLLPGDPVLLNPKNLHAVCEQASQAFLPVVGPTRDCLAGGVFMAYHCDLLEVGRQTGRQAGRILAGAPLVAVPPERPRLKRLSVNLKVAQELDLTLSKQFLSRAYHLFQ
jgi:putative tryptophan/tyrosine transport system substrate-binding protein